MKKIVEVAVKRKVTVIMVTIAVLVFGAISLARLKTNLLPELTYPTVTVKTEYRQSAPTEIESLITKPIEEAVGIVKNVRRISSTSSTGQSEIMLEFNWGTNIDLAIMDIREKIDSVYLPHKAKRPVILRFDPSFEPIIRLGLFVKKTTSSKKSLSDKSMQQTMGRLRLIAEDSIKKSLDTVTGVAAVKVSGGLITEYQVKLDQQKLANFNLKMEDINNLITSENINISGGNLKDGSHQFILKTINQFKTIEDINKVIVTNLNGIPIYLGDLATVQQGFKEQKAITRMNGYEAVEIAVYKEGDSNVVAVSENVKQTLEMIEQEFPSDIKLEILNNQAVFIQNAVDDVMVTGIIGGILAVIILYTFLRNIWATIIISFSIPVSVVATFNLMYGNNITLNIMSLGGITLGIGMLLDNSIVVLENIHRQLESGKNKLIAATDGASEVISAVTASTLTTIAVFFPMVFVKGIAGQLFKDQALTITFSLIISLVVALTLIPMLAALGRTELPVNPEIKNRSRGKTLVTLLILPLSLTRPLLKVFPLLFKPFVLLIQAVYQRLEKIYEPVLRWSLKHKSVVIISAIGLFLFTLTLIPKLGVELMPSLAQKEITVSVKLPPGSPLQNTDRVVANLQQKVSQIPEVKSSFSISGSGNRFSSGKGKQGENNGELNVILKNEGGRSEEMIMASIRSILKDFPGVNYKLQKPGLFSFKTPLEIEMSGYHLSELTTAAHLLTEKMIASRQFKDIKSTVDEGHPELQIHFDREKLSVLGLYAYDIANRLLYKVQGEVPSKFSDKEKKIDIRVNLAEKDRSSINSIKQLVVNSEQQHPITLDSVATIKEGMSPGEIKRIDQNRVAVVSADYATGDLGSAVKTINNIIEDLPLAPGITVDISGQNQEMEVSFASLKMALLLAVFLVYLVMASQFESWIHPFLILFSIPLSLIGAALALYLTDSKISIVVFIGGILLAGIVVNNAIVLIDKINQLRSTGVEKLEAIIEAGRLRLRPILMTTLTTTLGLVPMALGVGDGSEIRSPMAVTVIGGLLGSTLLTLVIIPTVYSIIDRKK